ncbi:MAG: hypothetical protein IJM45_08425 [Clostridia bacterium]|nr:hypothetical protein [Clostridia bacterium]
MKAVYKLVTLVLTVAFFPAVVFAPFFKLLVTSNLLSLFTSSSDDVMINASYSIKDIAGLLEPYSEQLKSFSFTDIPEAIRDAIGLPFALFLGFFILAVLTDVLLLILGVFTRKRRAAFIFALLGVVFTVGMNISFGYVSKPLVNGSISISELLGPTILSGIGEVQSGLSSLVTSLMGSGSQLIVIKLLNLSTAYILMLLVFIAEAVWTISHIIADPDPEKKTGNKSKKSKKRA